MNNLIAGEKTIIQDTLSEVANKLICEIKADKKRIENLIAQATTNINILEKENDTTKELNHDKHNIFKANYTEFNYNNTSIDQKLLIEKENLEQLNNEYKEVQEKERDLIRINNYFKKIKIFEGKEYTDKQDVNGLKLLETQEIERKRIARELHDSTVQNLTNLVHKTELCTKLVDIDSIRAKLELQTMISTIKTTINDMRNIIYDLRPMSLEDLGLVITVKRYIKQFIDSSNCKVLLNVENEKKITSDIIDLTLFRIIQEACNNAIKHAHATVINIDLVYNDCYIDLVIKDNGCGFDKDVQTDREFGPNKSLSGFGLSMMKERVGLLSGEFELTSKINDGTCIKVRVPIN